MNRSPSAILRGKIPAEMLFGVAPSFGKIRVSDSFRCAHNQRAKGDKFASCSQKCMFMGYPTGKKVYDLERKEFFASRDVKFYEDVFTYADSLPSAPVSSIPDTVSGEDAPT